MINFNDLPNEIKFTIFQMNRKDTANEIRNNKIEYDRNVVQELNYIFEKTNNGYYDKTEYEAFKDLVFSFSHSVLVCIFDLKIDSAVEKEQEKAFNQYYQLEDY